MEARQHRTQKQRKRCCLTLVFNVAVRLLLLDEEAFPDGKDATLRFVRRQEVSRALVDRALES